MRWITPIAVFYASRRKRLGPRGVHFEAGLLVRALSTSSKPGIDEAKELQTAASATMKTLNWVSAVATGAAVVGVCRQSVYERYS